MTGTEPFTWTISLTEISSEGTLEASRRLSADECAALAQRAGIDSVVAFRTAATIRRWSGGVIAEVALVADVIQACVISLEPVPAHIEEKFIARYVPGAFVPDKTGEVEVNLDEEDPPEPFDGNHFDLAPVLVEHFILALDPYPRAPNAILPPEFEAGPVKASPFAVLKGLKDKD